MSFDDAGWSRDISFKDLVVVILEMKMDFKNGLDFKTVSFPSLLFSQVAIYLEWHTLVFLGTVPIYVCCSNVIFVNIHFHSQKYPNLGENYVTSLHP